MQVTGSGFRNHLGWYQFSSIYSRVLLPTTATPSLGPWLLQCTKGFTVHVNITVVTFKVAKIQPQTQKCFALRTRQVPKAGLQVSQQNLSISSLCLHALWTELLCLYRKKKNVGNKLSFTPHIYSHLCAPPLHTEPEGTTGGYCQLPKGDGCCFTQHLTPGSISVTSTACLAPPGARSSPASTRQLKDPTDPPSDSQKVSWILCCFFPLASLWPPYRYTLKTEVEKKQNKDLNIALHILGVGTLK